MGKCLRVLYANGGIVREQESELIQNSINIFINLFWKYGLGSNVSKSQTQPHPPLYGALQDMAPQFLSRRGSENSSKPGRLMQIVDIVQYMWSTGEISRELGWTILVLIPKLNTDTRGIGLLETLWKVVEAIINTRLRSSIQFHNVLHRFRAGRGKGTATMELKITQDITSVYQDPLFLAFLELRKSYDMVNHSCLIRTLEGYSAGRHMCELLATFWAHQEVVTRQNGYHFPNFKAAWVKTQGGIISTTLFNVVKDNVV